MKLAVVIATTLAAQAAYASTVLTNTDEVRACAPHGHGFLVGTGGGLALTDERGEQQKVWTAVDGLPATRIDSIETINGALWVGTEKGGAEVKLDRGTLRVVRTMGTTAMRDVIAFRGTTYAATEQGVLTADLAAPVAMKGGNAKQRLNVRALAVVSGQLYAGTAAGLYRLDGDRFVHLAYTSETDAADIMSMYAEGTLLWIATVGGLYSYDKSTLVAYGGGELRRVTFLDGKITVASVGGGVLVVDRTRLVKSKALSDLVMTQAIDTNCAGGLDGLWVRTDDAWVHPIANGGLPGNDVSALAADGEALWVGMFDHGVARYANGGWMRITSERLDRRVNAMLVDKTPTGTRVWVATATGVSTIDMTSNTTYAVTELGKADGLPARGALSLVKMKDGRILAGTMHGAVILGRGRPQHIGIKQGINTTNVWAVAEDANGDLWLGTTTGLYRGRPDDPKWTRYAIATGEIKDDWVMALTVDPTSGAVFAGTYKGGVTRFDNTKVTQLGGGWINPSGLAWRDGSLFASTMEGLRVGDGSSSRWTTTTYAARDTTATARVGNRMWVATRRGITAP